jgi:hypothetical protein
MNICIYLVGLGAYIYIYIYSILVSTLPTKDYHLLSPSTYVWFMWFGNTYIYDKCIIYMISTHDKWWNTYMIYVSTPLTKGYPLLSPGTYVWYVW